MLLLKPLWIEIYFGSKMKHMDQTIIIAIVEGVRVRDRTIRSFRMKGMLETSIFNSDIFCF